MLIMQVIQWDILDHVNVQLIYDMFVDELLMMDPNRKTKFHRKNFERKFVLEEVPLS
jgi:hypothetical protein